jgi:hypothetical protein
VIDEEEAAEAEAEAEAPVALAAATDERAREERERGVDALGKEELARRRTVLLRANIGVGNSVVTSG